MAILSDYAIGTVSIAANGLVATGTGTAWNIQSFQEGDTLMVDGFVAVIAGPATSATSIPLTRPWLGGVKTNVPYRIRYMSDGSRYTNKAQELINLLGDGTLTALATVGSAIDKISYWAGAGVAALTDLSTFARTKIINQVDRAALLSAATGIDVSVNVQGIARSSTDYNLEVQSGWVSGSNTTLNSPVATAGVVNIITWQDGTWIVQVWYEIIGIRQFIRRKNGGTGVWTAWTVQPNSLVGTVSQTSGVATGAIIERGSNANGEYVRFADGTQICWSLQDLSSQNITTARGSIFGSALLGWNFPIAFSTAAVRLSYSFERNDTSYTGGGSTLVANATALNYVAWNSSSNPSGNNKSMTIIAIGRWF